MPEAAVHKYDEPGAAVGEVRGPRKRTNVPAVGNAVRSEPFCDDLFGLSGRLSDLSHPLGAPGRGYPRSTLESAEAVVGLTGSHFLRPYRRSHDSTPAAG